MARKPRQFFKASDWELEDAEHENVQIIVNRAPKSFVVENGVLKGMMFERLEYEIRGRRDHGDPRARGGVLPVRRCDSRHRPGECLSLDRARHRHRVRQVERAEGRQEDLSVQPRRRVLRRRCGIRAEEHHLVGGARPSGRDFDPQVLLRRADHEPHAARRDLEQPQDGHARVVLQERVQRRRAAPRPARRAHRAVQEDQRRGGTGIHRRAGRARGAALPQLRRADRVRGETVHRMRCVHRHLSRRLPHHRAERPARRSCARASRRRRQSGTGPVRIERAAADRARHGQGRGRVRALRPVRGALSHRRLGHAEIDDQDSLAEDESATCRT